MEPYWVWSLLYEKVVSCKDRTFYNCFLHEFWKVTVFSRTCPFHLSFHIFDIMFIIFSFYVSLCMGFEFFFHY